MSDDYLLGMTREEIDRLAQQHEAWRGPTGRVWVLAGIASGQTVVDLGSGPGFTTVDLARRVGERGRVIAMDASRAALDELRATADRKKLGRIETVEADVATLDLSAWRVDAVFARWLFWVLSDPASVVRRVAAGLQPGATFSVIDYCNYHGVGTEPASPLFTRMFRAVYQSCADAGGSLDVAGRMPALMAAAGFIVSAVEPLQQVGRPGTPVWRWVSNFQRLYFPTLVEKGYITAADLEEFHAWWASLEQDPHSLFFAPPMLGIVGVRA